MKKMTIQDAELLAQRFRTETGISFSEPINVKTLLRKYNILTMYRPLSNESYGISIRTENARFIMVNSNTTRGRQHFTIAHEIFHLFYDDDPKPHICNGMATVIEKNANLFAAALLIPREGLLREIPEEEMLGHNPSLATILRLEQFFGVSRNSLLIRLKDIGIIDKKKYEALNSIAIKESARAYGYDTSLYEKGNENMVIGVFGEKARRLFEENKISEGHYVELLNMIGCGGYKD